MGLGLLDRLQEKIELFRLEQRYTRRKGRDGFVSEAQYVDGEYIYNHRDVSEKGAVKWSSREIPMPDERRMARKARKR